MYNVIRYSPIVAQGAPVVQGARIVKGLLSCTQNVDHCGEDSDVATLMPIFLYKFLGTGICLYMQRMTARC